MVTPKIKDRYMTIRLPSEVEVILRRMADEGTRTLAAQVLHCIKAEIERQQLAKAGA